MFVSAMLPLTIEKPGSPDCVCHLSFSGCVQSIKQTNKYFERPKIYACAHSNQTLVEKFVYQLRLKPLYIKIIGFANSLQLYLKIKILFLDSHESVQKVVGSISWDFKVSTPLKWQKSLGWFPLRVR